MSTSISSHHTYSLLSLLKLSSHLFYITSQHVSVPLAMLCHLGFSSHHMLRVFFLSHCLLLLHLLCLLLLLCFTSNHWNALYEHTFPRQFYLLIHADVSQLSILVPYAELKTQNLLYIFNKQIKCKVSKIKILPPTQFLPKSLLFGKLKSVSCSVMSDYLQPHGL